MSEIKSTFHETEEEPRKSYADMYKEGCLILNESPGHLPLYEDLDKIKDHIESLDETERTLYREALSEKRTCMAVPYEMWLASHGDERFSEFCIDSADGLLYPASMGLDSARSKIADLMDNDYDCYGDVRKLIKKKFTMLSRYVDQPWSEYVVSYLNGCREMALLMTSSPYLYDRYV